MTISTIQFENANEGRSYPFDDNSDLTDRNGRILDSSIIVDLHLVVPSPCTAYLSSVYLSNNVISACINVYNGSIFYGATSVIITKDIFEAYRPYRLEKLIGSEDIGGIITFGNIAFDKLPRVYRFLDHTVRVLDSAISRYTPSKLRKLYDPRTGETLSGDVKLVFSKYITAETSDGGIKLSLTEGADDALATYCDKNKSINACGATPITSINGVTPDLQNRIVIWFH